MSEGWNRPCGLGLDKRVRKLLGDIWAPVVCLCSNYYQVPSNANTLPKAPARASQVLQEFLSLQHTEEYPHMANVALSRAEWQ